MKTILDFHLLNVTKKTANEYSSACPRCGGDDRFFINLAKATERGGFFKCRQCEIHGDGITYLKEFHGVGYHDACELLGCVAKVNYTKSTQTNSSAANRIQKLSTTPCQAQSVVEEKKYAYESDKWQAQAQIVLNQFQKNIESPEALAFLNSRAIDIEYAKELGLGWNSEKQYLDAVKWGCAENTKVVIDAGLIYANIRDDKIVSINVRVQNSVNSQKYKVVKGGKLACLTVGKLGAPCIVVESYLDACLLYQEACKIEKEIFVVATTGGGNKIDEYAQDGIAKSRQIILCPDNPLLDDVGAKAYNEWKAMYPRSRAFYPGYSKDIGDMQQSAIQTQGYNNPYVKNWICNALRCRTNRVTNVNF